MKSQRISCLSSTVCGLSLTLCVVCLWHCVWSVSSTVCGLSLALCVVCLWHCTVCGLSLTLCVVCCRFTVLPHSTLPDFYTASLPSLVRFCRAFPPLCDDAISLLLQLGRSVHAHLSTVNASCVGRSLFSLYL